MFGLPACIFRQFRKLRRLRYAADPAPEATYFLLFPLNLGRRFGKTVDGSREINRIGRGGGAPGETQ